MGNRKQSSGKLRQLIVRACSYTHTCATQPARVLTTCYTQNVLRGDTFFWSKRQQRPARHTAPKNQCRRRGGHFCADVKSKSLSDAPWQAKLMSVVPCRDLPRVNMTSATGAPTRSPALLTSKGITSPRAGIGDVGFQLDAVEVGKPRPDASPKRPQGCR